MRVLIDTHILIWSIYDDSRIPKELMTLLSDENVIVEFSILSLWEIEIKHQKYPDKFTCTAADLEYYAILSGYKMTDLETSHIYALGSLKHDETVKHNDPFDKMLIAQAKTEGILFATHDKRLTAYNEPCVKYF